MLSQIDKLKYALSLAVLVIPSFTGWGQEDLDVLEWGAAWIEILSSEDLSDSQKLVEQTDLLLEWGAADGWGGNEIWERTVELLNAWENSPDIDIARSSYLGILEKIGWTTLDSGSIQSHEPQLRDFYQRALRITRNPEEEGKLLFHLATSIYRSVPDSLETRRRIEAYLDQASLAVGNHPISGNIHFLLGSIYAEWGQSSDLSVRDETSYFSQAVFHFQQVLTIPDVYPEIAANAESALEKLLQPGLEMDVKNRYLPQNDIRIPVSSRNVPELSVKLFKIPGEVSGLPVSMAKLRSFEMELDTETVELISDETVLINMRNRVDWQDSEIRLGSDIGGGWYAIEVSGGGQVERSLLLVTSIETVLVPRENGNMTLWAVDAETGEPIENVLYHVFDEHGRNLFSGSCNASGMADIVMGQDDTWTELHANYGDNPAVINKSDLIVQVAPSPWVVPDAVSVFPGDTLGWVILDDSGDSDLRMDNILILLPDGSGLLPQKDESGTERGFNIQIPEEVDEYGPIYITLANGKSVLLSHLKRRDPLPLEIELSGEQFAADQNLFVSSAPVGLRISQNENEEFEGPGFIRVLVETINRPASFMGQLTSSEVSSEVVFEHITRFGDAKLPEAYWELPEIAQTENPVPLRIKVYPLDSDDLLGEAYLAIVPYRARVSLASSERIIPNGESVMIEIMDVQRGLALTRSPAGELVAFRETWENRYVHRKKGTPLSESDYNSLPDRSLLGSAKTDYRLLERGIVREEVLRNAINPVNNSRIPIVFERHGYYRIEFHGRDVDVRAHYPEGPLEVWVLPESGELDAFRSERPRLLVEETKSGGNEILVLLDRTDASILLDLQGEDGRSLTQVIEPESSGYYAIHTPGSSPLEVCRAIISGNSRTDFLCQRLSSDIKTIWDVSMERVNGLNPGSKFSWGATLDEGSFGIEPVWAIYPESDRELAENCLVLQRLEHGGAVHGCEVESISLNNWLPLFEPIGSQLQEQVPDDDENDPFSDLLYLGAIYPELHTDSARRGGFVDFDQTLSEASSDEFTLTGTLPLTAGRWCLISFSPSSANWIDVRSWPFSTELPIRTTLSGPPILRSDDIALATLTAENTTRRVIDVEVISESEDSLRALDPGPIEVQLEAGETLSLPLAIKAFGGGEGRVSSVVVGSQSSSTAYLESLVQTSSSIPVFKSFVAQPGFDGWQESVNLKEWNSIGLLVSSGTGGHLGAIWPAIRESYLEREPLLTGLADWSLGKVQNHHGISGLNSSQSVETFTGHLKSFSSDSGLAWTQGSDPDPWLSALTLWGLETFSQMSDVSFDNSRDQLRTYLESVLIDDSKSAESRIFALRTFAARAYHDPRIRPSRIQAKSFLEFFHNRDERTVGELAMLLDVARAYRFNEEVRLLSDYLRSRLDDPAALNELSLWNGSLIYLALSQGSSDQKFQDRLLESIFGKIELMSIQPGWEQVGSFLNLLASFLWEGDFSVDGIAVFKQGNQEPLRISLKPHGSNLGKLELQQSELSLEGDALALGLDTSLSEQPVIITLFGRKSTGLSFPAYPDQGETVLREYVEHTLLAGSHIHSINCGFENIFYPDDTLRIELTLEVDQSQPYSEFTFMIPAGARLSGEAIEHTIKPSSTEAILVEPRITREFRGDPLKQKIRIEPLSPGTHNFVLPYQVRWGGTFSFPAHQLVYPKSGQSFKISSDATLIVDPASN